MNLTEYGKISIAGPATNIAQALIYLLVYLFSPDSLISVIAFYGVQINAFLALFNLIPFGAFDGLKIYNWDKKAWGTAVAIAGVLVLFIWF